MKKQTGLLVQQDPWQQLRSLTNARIALGRAGASTPCAELLRFSLAHAQARDAVHCLLDCDALQQELALANFRSLRVHSKADNRHTYLLRPDLGRRLDEDSASRLAQAPRATELAIVIADGLSATAVQRHAVPLLKMLRTKTSFEWNTTPVVLAQQGRVALGDEIGEMLGAKIVAVLIGERPGLSSPDSLGIYLTYEPRVGRMDSERNCISNVRPEGLSYEAAAYKLAFLIKHALQLQLSGVLLKEGSAMHEAMLPPADSF
ncbi:ethanolamine ammonia-lyase subunit EutC [Noviherbaspirillum saxi]|uniref:Ethanolamine ammonia-lyase small subunit n=1 Tax=Noviherbaspirillum saxi TaxID=2320863 RepID=A0A3A3FN25_9BURK|nr:ethanolamine ammonia-lyase subunit EutC [Noviherbaspirillum saxi]RJF96131.1 ethanolamine ammonia-lyase subunit EutC [Noviherbaspirillum saxi]